MATSDPAPEGVYVVGRLVDQRAGKPWKGRQGQDMDGGWEVTLLVGRTTRTVRYRAESDASRALEAAAPGDTVSLMVFLAVRKGYLFFDGPSARSAAEAA